MASKVEQDVENSVKSIIEELGYDLEYVEYIKEGTEKILRVVIDKIGSLISIDDCEKVSRAIENVIEDKNLVKQEYVLEVSSPGIERVLKNDRLYEKYINEKIRFSLYKQVEGRKIIEGNIIEIKEEKILVKSEENTYEIEKKNIAHANTIYDFN